MGWSIFRQGSRFYCRQRDLATQFRRIDEFSPPRGGGDGRLRQSLTSRLALNRCNPFRGKRNGGDLRDAAFLDQLAPLIASGSNYLTPAQKATTEAFRRSRQPAALALRG